MAVKKQLKQKATSMEELEEEMDTVEKELSGMSKSMNGEVEIEAPALKMSKPVAQLKKGDKIKVDALTLEVDAHTVLIDHGTTKEMAIECFDPKKDKDYEVRYFDDQVERTIEVYELQEIMYIKKPAKKIEW